MDQGEKNATRVDHNKHGAEAQRAVLTGRFEPVTSSSGSPVGIGLAPATARELADQLVIRAGRVEALIAGAEPPKI
jgi:hypothetical protein